MTSTTEHKVGTFGVALTVEDGRVFTTSLEVAARFSKRHDHVLRDIRRLASEGNALPNFGERQKPRFFLLSSHTIAGQRETEIYNLTRDGFMLLAMGFTGPEALKWKLQFIDAFNIMERKIAEDRERQIRASIGNDQPSSLSTSIVRTLTYTPSDSLKHGIDMMLCCEYALRALADWPDKEAIAATASTLFKARSYLVPVSQHLNKV